MVRATTLSLALCATATATFSSTIAVANASVSTESLESLPRFDVPSFDYRSLRDGDTPSRVLQALEKDGILALRNIPNYASLRERYLASAVSCALASENDEHARFLSTKFFADGTKRLTLEANAGRELEATSVANAAVAAKCPAYHALYAEFSRALEHAVNTFGDALDHTDFVVSDGEVPISSRKLVSDAVRLDHLHVYEPSQLASGDRQLRASSTELSLPLHEDHGLFIAMAAPMFFRVAHDGEVATRRLVSNASGLVIRTGDSRSVRPVLKDDEVVIMMGTGASRWLQTNHRIPAVMHGMRMPEELAAAQGARNLRAWFGKMTLLPAYQRVLASRQSFGEFANRTTRYLLERNAADLKTIGCATGRRLHDSGGSCAYRKCTLKKDPGIVPPTVGCHQACNYGTEFFNAKCEKKCDCEEQPKDGVICWMLCTARFPVNECPLENQVCEGLRNICTLAIPEPPISAPTTAPTNTPKPSTSAPTSAPTTTPDPTTPAPTPSSTTAVSSPATAAPKPTPVTAILTPAPTSTSSSPVTIPAPTTIVPPTPAASPEPTMPVRGQC